LQYELISSAGTKIGLAPGNRPEQDDQCTSEIHVFSERIKTYERKVNFVYNDYI
jgi:hypothetical protein